MPIDKKKNREATIREGARILGSALEEIALELDTRAGWRSEDGFHGQATRIVRATICLIDVYYVTRALLAKYDRGRA